MRLVKGKPLSPSTRVGYERLWKRNVLDTIGKRELRAIRKESVRDWHSAVATKSDGDQSAKSYRLLRAVLATAEADDLIRANPCRIREAGQEHAAERPMVATSLVLDLAEAIERRYRAIVLLAGFREPQNRREPRLATSRRRPAAPRDQRRRPSAGTQR